jgi:hypothetical protein
MTATILASILVAAPALSAAVPVATQDLAIIRYEKTACFGFCPVFVVTLRSDGEGVFEGQHYTAVQGARRFHITPERFRAFAAALAPLRPRAGKLLYDEANRCHGAGAAPSDGSSTGVAWRTREGRETVLYFYDGCGVPEVRRRLDAARALLPIEAFVGRPCLRNCRR